MCKIESNILKLIADAITDIDRNKIYFEGHKMHVAKLFF